MWSVSVASLAVELLAVKRMKGDVVNHRTFSNLFHWAGKYLWDHRVQPVTEHRPVNQTMALTATPRLSLNISRGGDSTASLGSPGQFLCLIFLSVNKFLLMPNLPVLQEYLYLELKCWFSII